MFQKRVLGLLIFGWLMFNQFVHAQKNTSNQPNVVIIFTDDHRFDAVGALGNGQVKTPNLDTWLEGFTTFSYD